MESWLVSSKGKMSQRASTSVSNQAQEDGSQQQQSFPPDNHLMPDGLRKIPEWYQDGQFRYNFRFWVGFIPGALLVATVEGKLYVAAIILGMLLTLLMRSMGSSYLAMALAITHVFALEVINVYCMTPLVWQSILNAPLFVLFHAFTAVSGIWWWLQDEEFRRQDPRFIIVMERVVFYLYPAISVTMVTWVFGMLFGRNVLPFVTCIAGLIALSLYMVPLQSSFAKPQTPTQTGMIQHWAVAWLYITLELCFPAVIYIALSYTGTIESILTLGLLIVGPPFLLTLLESQGLFYWTGMEAKPVRFIRWTAGTLVLSFFSMLVYTSQPSSLLPLLLVPALFTQLGLVSTVEESLLTPVSLVLATVLGLLYTTAFTLLPWSISYSFTFLSLPLSVVQLLFWCISMATIVMVTLWKKMTPHLWLLYNAAFVVCEYILSWDGVYPPYLAMATGTAAAILFWRLNSLGQMSLNLCLLNTCFHITKLSLLLPSSPHTPTTSTLTTIVAIFLVSLMLMRVLVFSTIPDFIPPSQLLVYSAVLLVGLLLSIDSLLIPLWASLTHQLPSSASILATILVVVGVFVSHGVSLVRFKEVGKLSYIPPGLFALATILALLQPEFSVQEMGSSLMVIMLSGQSIGSKGEIPVDMLLRGWTNLVVWLALIAVLATLGAAMSGKWRGKLTTAAASFLGAMTGFLAAIALLHLPPLSPMSMLYAAMCSLAGALLGRAFTAKHTGGMVDKILFALLLLAFLAEFYGEFTLLPRVYMPGKTWLSLYSYPCTNVLMAVTAVLAVAFRAKMYHTSDQSYLPLLGNICCVIFFLLSLVHPLHTQLEVSVVLSSCILLLAQPDNLLMPKTTSIFLAPSLLASVTVLYCLALSKVMPKMMLIFSRGSSLYIAARLMEMVCLASSIPGQAIFLYYLWTGKQLKLSILYLVLYILPNGGLPQFASSTSSTLLGCIGVLSFCLLMVGDYANLKIH